MPADNRPRCPRCGCPARYVLAPALLRFELNLDGSERRVMSARNIRRGADDLYECGARHTWRSPTPTLNLDDDRNVK